MGDIVVLNMETTLDLPLERILNGARDNEVTDCLLLGYGKDGEFYMASQTVDCGKLLCLLERSRDLLVRRMRGDDG